MFYGFSNLSAFNFRFIGDCNKMTDGQRLMIISLAFLAVDHRQQLSMLSVGRNNNSELLGRFVVVG